MGSKLYGCVEAGGTKFVCAVASGPDDIRARVRIPTTMPEETLAAATAFFAAHGGSALAAFGVASFGPLELDPASPRYGQVLRTPKPGWNGADMVAPFAAFGRPVGFDTDVNGALLGEVRWGAARGCRQAVYLTVGTGIGGGLMVDGRPVHGAGHPEMGHARPARHPDDRDFAGLCPFHGDCHEGLASGPAIMARWGSPLSALPANHAAHGIVAYYLGQLCVTLAAFAAPERIVIGGGVMETDGLIGRVRTAADVAAAGYFARGLGERIVPPTLGDRAGIAGAAVLGETALVDAPGLEPGTR